MKERLEAAVADAAAFVESRPVEAIAAIEPPALAEVLRELAALRAARREGEQWALMLQWSDGENPAVADIYAWVNERLPRLDEAIRHFELAWMAIPDERAGLSPDDEGVARDRHYLLSVRRFTPFMLSPAEERVLSAREASAGTAWKSLRDRTLGGPDDALRRRHRASASGRCPSSSRRAARTPTGRYAGGRPSATSELVEPALPVLAQCYDAVVADRLSVDRLRGHDDPMAAAEPRERDRRARGRGAARRGRGASWHRAALVRGQGAPARPGAPGLDRPVCGRAIEAPPLPWDEGRRLTVEVFDGLSPALGAEAERFFSEQRIDAETRRGKPYGAFCIWPSTRVPGFALVNWSGQLGDLVALAHELGHGTHYALAAGAQTDNSFEPGLTVAEIPSTFAELRLVDHLLEIDPELGRAALLARARPDGRRRVHGDGPRAVRAARPTPPGPRDRRSRRNDSSELCGAELAEVEATPSPTSRSCARRPGP